MQVAAGEDQPQVAVVFVPFPAQGHLSSLLRLSRHVSAYDIPVHYLASATHIRQVRARVGLWDPSASVHFHEFPTPSFPNLSPDPNSSHNFPMHIQPMMLAILAHLHEPLSMLVQKLSSTAKRVVVIFDALTSTAVRAVHAQSSRRNVEFYIFQATSALFLCSSLWEALGKLDMLADKDGIVKELPSTKECIAPEFLETADSQFRAADFHWGTIYNTSRMIEGEYLDLLAKLPRSVAMRDWALGLLNPLEKRGEGSRSYNVLEEWLDKQPPNSVILVSFGSTCSLSDEQITELAFGLERSQQKFVWALRPDADKGDIFTGDVRGAELPEGFEEGVKERGIIVRDWAPQLEILGHPSTGGFLSHCGWNSCMESISTGVPVAGWPMHSDHPSIAVLLTKVLRLGLQVRDWKRRDELVSSVAVEEAVRRLMASEEGNEMRQRARKLADSIKQSTMEGGATRREMDSFIAHMSR